MAKPSWVQSAFPHTHTHTLSNQEVYTCLCKQALELKAVHSCSTQPARGLALPEKWAVLESTCVVIGWAGAAVRAVSCDCTCACPTRSTCFTIRSHPISNHLSSTSQRKCQAKRQGCFLVLAGKTSPLNTQTAGAFLIGSLFLSFILASTSGSADWVLCHPSLVFLLDPDSWCFIQSLKKKN